MRHICASAKSGHVFVCVCVCLLFFFLLLFPFWLQSLTCPRRNITISFCSTRAESSSHAPAAPSPRMATSVAL